MSAGRHSEPHYFAIAATGGGYLAETYATRQAAEHARRQLFGTRALAHSIVRVMGQPRKPA